MSKKGKFEYKEFKEFNDKIQKLSKEQVDLFITACAKRTCCKIAF